MKILQIDLIHFGKFHHKTISFCEGMQIIQGENEAGKTTIHQFIRAMLFGAERGKTALMRPWDSPDACSGSMVLEWKGKRYRIYRSFARSGQSIQVTDLSDGTQYTREEQWQEILLPMTKALFDNTVSIGQGGAGQEKGTDREAAAYLANMLTSGSRDVDIRGALEELEKRKRSILGRRTKERLADAVHRAEEAAGMESRLRQLEQEIGRLDRETEEEREEETAETEEWLRSYPLIREKQQHLQSLEQERKKRKKGCLWAALLSLTAAAVCVFLQPAAAAVLAAAGLAFLILRGLQRPGREEAELRETVNRYCSALPGTAEGKAGLEQEIRRLTGEKEQRRQLLERSARQRERLLWEAEQLEEWLSEAEDWEKEKQRLEEEVRREELERRALELAVSVIREQAGQLQGTFGERFRKKASAYFRFLTGERHEELLLDEAYSMTAREGIWYPKVKELSRGAAEKAWFAVRLAMGEELSEEPLCFLLDDTFAYLDDKSLESALELLEGAGRRGHQVLLFTCQGREAACLREKGIPVERLTAEGS